MLEMKQAPQVGKGLTEWDIGLVHVHDLSDFWVLLTS
jgi:hypothetical protein